MNAPFKPEAFTDPDEAHEAAREEALEEFADWQRADYDRREFEDFGNWLANKARWNGGEKYALAMTWAERGVGLLTDPQLVGLSKGHRQFNRENRRVGGSR